MFRVWGLAVHGLFEKALSRSAPTYFPKVRIHRTASWGSRLAGLEAGSFLLLSKRGRGFGVM